jgi:hypothetical protein
MPSLPLVHLAHARSGDKGDTANVGVIAYDARDFELLRTQLTPAAVKAHFDGLVEGDVERFELPNLRALNFLLHGALDGGGTVSLMNDAQGKVFSSTLLRMEVQVSEEVAERVRGRGRVPETFTPAAYGGAGGDPAAGADLGSRRSETRGGTEAGEGR